MRFVSCLLLVLSSLVVFSQSIVPFQESKGVLWGVMDTTSGKKVLEPKYEFIDNFSDGLARVTNNYMWGAINEKGEIVVPLIYNHGIFRSRKGNSIVNKNNLWGLVNTSNDFVLPLRFSNISYNEQHNLYVAVDSTGQNLYSAKGEKLTAKPYEHIEVFFTNGFTKVRQNNLKGMIDTNGAEIIPPIYQDVRSFVNGYSHVQNNYKHGYIDQKGDVTVPLIYDDMWDYANGFSRVELNGKKGYVNRKGKLVVPTEYLGAQKFSEGMVVVTKDFRKRGVINYKGELIVPLEYSSIYEYKNGHTLARKNDKWYKIDKQGNVTNAPLYKGLGTYYNSYTVISENNTNGLIDKNNKIIVVPGKYNIDQFKNGLAIVRKNNKQGVMDSAGNLIIPVIYKHIERLYGVPHFIVRNSENKYGILNNLGQVVVPFQYDGIADLNKRYLNVKTLCSTYESKRLGLMWSNGTVLCKPKYNRIGQHTVWEKRTSVAIADKWGFVDDKGLETTAPKYTSVDKYHQGVCIVSLNDKWGFINLSGEEVIPLKYDRVYLFIRGKATVELNGEVFKINILGERVE